MQTNGLKSIAAFRLLLVGCLAGVLYLPSAFAICVGTNCACTVSTITTNFGNYSLFDASPNDTTGNVEVTCTADDSLDVDYNIELNGGDALSFNPRKMSNGGNTLDYNLYTNSGRSIVWGDGTGATVKVNDSYTLAQTNEVRNYTVYGRIPAFQNVPVGTYNDTITVTVEY